MQANSQGSKSPKKSSQSITFSTKNIPQISPNSEMCFVSASKNLRKMVGFGGGGFFFPTQRWATVGPSWTPSFTRAQPVDGLLQLLSQRFVCDVFTENSQQAHQGHSFHHLDQPTKQNKNWSFGKNSWDYGWGEEIVPGKGSG